jgi:hypothetical protein
MPTQVVSGAQLSCSLGTSLSSLTVLPTVATTAGGNPAASIEDHVALLNISPFGLCTSLANPQVAAATAAALGVLTPQPCLPVTTSLWTPGSSSVLIDSVPALHSAGKCMCQWAGVISVVSPSQTRSSIR